MPESFAIASVISYKEAVRGFSIYRLSPRNRLNFIRTGLSRTFTISFTLYKSYITAFLIPNIIASIRAVYPIILVMSGRSSCKLYHYAKRAKKAQ